MKKLLALILTLATLLVLAACGETPITPTEAEATTVGPHEHIFVDEVTPATCFEGGITVHRCSICGYKYSDGTAPRGHVYEIAEKVEPTYKSAGYVTYVCTGCGDTYTEELPELEYITGEETLDKFVSYSEMQADVDAKRDKLYADSNATDVDISEYLPEYTGNPLLTQEEIDKLTTKTDSSDYTTVLHDKAVEDIDLYFRALKYAYGGYYYFGGDEAFGAAKAAILDDISGMSKITAKQLASIMLKHLDFVIDGHFSIQWNRRTNDTDVAYEYYYCKGQNYALDEGGHYKLIDGEKWYYVGCENEAVSMQYSLDEKGHIVYSLARFCPIADKDGNLIPDHDEITLTNGEYIKKQNVEWIENEPYGYNGVDFNYFKENGIAYISVRSFDRGKYDSILQEYSATGADVKDAKVIIYDTRSNSGGSDQYSMQWCERFARAPSPYRIISARRTGLNYHNSQFRSISVNYNKIKRIPNDIPIIFLTDDLSGSAGESVWFFTSSLKNVTVIGANTAGCMICGNVATYYLPNTCIPVVFGENLNFPIFFENIDGKGFEPDIWCNPKDALNVAMQFIITNGLAEKEDVDAMRVYFPGEESDLFSLYYEDAQTEVMPLELASKVGTTAVVYFDGKPITDYVVTVQNTVGTAEIVDGKVKLTSLKSGRTFKFRVHYNGYYAEFYWMT